MKTLIENYLGYPPAAPGEGTAWRWEFVSPWPADWPWPIASAVTLVLIAVTVFIIHREIRRASWRVRLGLAVTRLLMLSIVLLCLCRVTLSVERTGLPFLAVMIDDSASMQIEDEYGPGEPLSDLLSMNVVPRRGRVPRSVLLKAILRSDQSDFLRRLMDQHKLKFYRFANEAVPLGDSEYHSGSDLDGIRQLIDELDPQQEGTRPGPAIEQVLNELQGTPPSAIVILSDGVATESASDRFSQVVSVARDQNVPLFSIGIGSPEPVRDVELLDVLLDDVAVVGAAVSVKGKLRSYSFSGRNVLVSIREQSTQTVVGQTTVPLGPDGALVPFELIFTPDEPGEFDYRIEVNALANEVNRENNQVIRHLSVRQARIRVLLADGGPRFEFRYLKHLLERIQQRDSTIEIHTVLQSGDPGYVLQDATAQPLQGRFPVSLEQLAGYDVVIFGDLNPELLGPSLLQNLHDYVAEQGGGLVVIAGSDHIPGALAGTPLDAALPIDPGTSSAPVNDAVDGLVSAFQPRWTVAGQSLTPLFRSMSRSQEAPDSWNQNPGMYWSAPVSRVRPGAVVVLERVPGSDGQAVQPLIVVQQFSRGKTVFHATDELWRWRFRQGDRLLEEYWIGVIQYLSRARLLGRDRSAELLTDRMIYEQGEDVVLRVRFLDGRLRDDDAPPVIVALERSGIDQRQIELHPVPGESNLLEATLPRAVEGSYHGWILAPSFDEAPPSCDFRVESSRREFRERTMDQRELIEAARGTGGAYYDVTSFRQLPRDLPAGTAVALGALEPRSLWDRWELLMLFTVLFVIDRIVRRRLRLR